MKFMKGDTVTLVNDYKMVAKLGCRATVIAVDSYKVVVIWNKIAGCGQVDGSYFKCRFSIVAGTGEQLLFNFVGSNNDI